MGSINVKTGDAVTVKSTFFFMGEPMFEKGEEWRIVEIDQNYILVQRGEDKRHWIGEAIFAEAFAGEDEGR